MARTVRPGRRWLRYTWIFAVLTLLCISVAHTTKLIEDFLKYGTTVYYKEETLDILKNSDRDSVPDFTLCNIQPLSLRAINNSEGILPYPDYLDMLTIKFHCPTCDGSFPVDLETQLRTPHGYFQYIGEDKARVVGHKLEDIVMECNVILSETSATKSLPCTGMLNISLIQFSDIFNCYSFSVTTQSPDTLIIGVSLILFAGAVSLDQFWHIGEPTFFSRGMLLATHSPSSFPFMTLRADGLSTGMLYTIPFTVMSHKRLPDPYGGCVKPQQSNYTHAAYSGYLRYTSTTCWSGCVEEAVITNCQCRDGDLAGVTFSTYPDLPYCADAHEPTDILAKRMLCAETQREKHKTPCYFNCPFSCSEASYDARPSHFIWPHKDTAKAFYDQYVHGKHVESLFGNITQLSNGACEAFNQSCSKFDPIVKQMQDNFLGVQTYLSEMKGFVVGTQPKMEPTQLFSQIGGALNLWSGISVIAVVELIELAINLIIARRQQNYLVNR